MNPWIRLASGRQFHFLRPHIDEIDIKDIAHNLSQLCRFTGASRRFYSIAEHCCHCCDAAPDEYKLVTLMHDAQEYACADLNGPLKSLLPQYKEIEKRAERVIARKYSLPFPHPRIVKEVDLRMLVTEMKQLMRGGDWRDMPFEPYDLKIEGWASGRARREFLKRFDRYKTT